MEASPPPKTVNLSDSTVGLAEPTIMTKFEDHKDKDMAKGDFYLIVARPKPQKDADKAKAQAEFIWGEVMELLEIAEDRKEIDTIFCWVFVPQEGSALRIHNDVIPLPTREREKIYEHTFCTEGMKEIDGLENRIFEVQPYVLGGTAGTLSQAVTFRSRIAIQDVCRFLDRYSELKEKLDFNKYWNSDYKELGIPLITLMAEKHLLNNEDRNWNDLTHYENTKVKRHDGELIRRA
ncbi:hypothetical protein ZTR_02788 [Talaromyces verruculosus]|nr:hypothetical protein ZTR_02788 [Talaromyces verruculosus]